MTTTETHEQPVLWADVTSVPHSPLRALAAERLFRLVVRRLPVRVCLPGGERLGAGGPVMRIERPAAFFHRLGVDAKIGFGESYLAGDWSAPDLADLLTPFAERMAVLVPRPLQLLRRWVDARQPRDEHNTVAGARRNIHRHYDLSNDLFGQFLDPTMTYSAAWFTDLAAARTVPGPASGRLLADGQHRKIDAILDLAGVRPGTRLLDIGTGWGELAIRAAQRGADVLTVTISEEQRDLAERRAAAAGARVDVRLSDYREVTGRFDAITSVEMIEAVGEEYWPEYFATLDRLLAPGGRIGLQAITMPHDRLLATRGSYTWIHKYVFPGGQVLSVPAIEQALRRHTTLHVDTRRPLGEHYACTLRLWRERFVDRWPAVAELGFDETFRRMWEFYLAYSEAGFRGNYLDTWQLGLTR